MFNRLSVIYNTHVACIYTNPTCSTKASLDQTQCYIYYSEDGLIVDHNME